MSNRCPMCYQASLVTPAELERRICDACATKIEPSPTADPRPRVPCRGCGHTLFVRTHLVDETDTQFARAGVPVTEPRVDRAVISGKVRSIRTVFTRRAPLVVYVCRGCGLTELYTDGFADLPFGPQYGAELIDVAPDASGGPFR